MEKKNRIAVGIGLLITFGLGTLMNWARVTDFGRMIPTLWFGTILMIILFIVGIGLLLSTLKD